MADRANVPGLSQRTKTYNGAGRAMEPWAEVQVGSLDIHGLQNPLSGNTRRRRNGSQRWFLDLRWFQRGDVTHAEDMGTDGKRLHELGLACSLAHGLSSW